MVDAEWLRRQGLTNSIYFGCPKSAGNGVGCMFRTCREKIDALESAMTAVKKYSVQHSLGSVSSLISVRVGFLSRDLGQAH